MIVASNELKRGTLLDLDKAPWEVLEVSFQTPSARGASMIVKAKIRNLKSAQVLQKSWRAGEMLEVADCERRSVQYLYRDGDGFVFMDEASYDQFTLGEEAMGDQAGFLLEGLGCRSLLYNGQVLTVELPMTVDLVVTETAPAMKNATAQAQLKQATLETGRQILVPPYLQSGEKVRVDTRDGRFIERVKE